MDVTASQSPPAVQWEVRPCKASPAEDTAGKPAGVKIKPGSAVSLQKQEGGNTARSWYCEASGALLGPA